MKIKRTTANKIMSLANRHVDSCLLGIMDKDETMINAFSYDAIKKLMTDTPQSIFIYNQSPETSEIKDKIEFSDGQQAIEIFQDTDGVFGLRAYCQQGKIQRPITLELSD